MGRTTGDLENGFGFFDGSMLHVASEKRTLPLSFLKPFSDPNSRQAGHRAFPQQGSYFPITSFQLLFW